MKGKQYDATLLNKFLYCSKHYICTVATILSRWYASTVGSCTVKSRQHLSTWAFTALVSESAGGVGVGIREGIALDHEKARAVGVNRLCWGAADNESNQCFHGL